MSISKVHNHIPVPIVGIKETEYQQFLTRGVGLLTRSRLPVRAPRKDQVPREERFIPFYYSTYLNNIVSICKPSLVSGQIGM